MNTFVREWVNEWDDQPSELVRPVIMLPEGISPTVEWVWREVWPSKTTKIQKCLLKLLNNHTDVVILCCNWDSDPPCILERDKYMFFSLESFHIITVSRRVTAGTSCFSLPRMDAVTSTGAGPKHQYRQTGSGYFSTYKFSSTSKSSLRRRSRGGGDQCHWINLECERKGRRRWRDRTGRVAAASIGRAGWQGHP